MTTRHLEAVGLAHGRTALALERAAQSLPLWDPYRNEFLKQARAARRLAGVAIRQAARRRRKKLP